MTIPKSYTREVVAYLAIGFLIFLLYDLRSHSRLIEDQFSSANGQHQAEVEYLKNELGKTVSAKQAAEISSRQFIDLYKRESAELRDDLNIKIKNLKSYVRAEFRATGGGSAVITNPVDSERVWDLELESGDAIDMTPYLYFKDGYLDFSSTMGRDPIATYTYTDTLVYAVAAKKKWILGKETLYGNGMFANPNAKITGSTDVLINNYRDKRWAVTIGPYYDPFRGQAGVSIGLGYTLIKF